MLSLGLSLVSFYGEGSSQVDSFEKRFSRHLFSLCEVDMQGGPCSVCPQPKASGDISFRFKGARVLSSLLGVFILMSNTFVGVVVVWVAAFSRTLNPRFRLFAFEKNVVPRCP